MELLDYRELGSNIKKVFLDINKYQFDKHVPTFKKDGKYIGDFFDITIFELNNDNPPIFYHTYSPYDIITKKSPYYASVFCGGELIFTTEFMSYIYQRTGVMTSIVLRGLGISKLSPRRVIFIGTGNIAQCGLSALKAYYPDLQNVSYINRSNDPNKFVDLAYKLEVRAEKTDIDHIGEFDIIICHTNSKEPVLTDRIKNNIKQGAVITTFSSEDFAEVSTSFFDTNEATVIIDWDQTADEASELRAAIDAGRVDKNKIVNMKELLANGISKANTHYVIYRSHGTPMQNLAVLQLLMKQK